MEVDAVNVQLAETNMLVQAIGALRTVVDKLSKNDAEQKSRIGTAPMHNREREFHSVRSFQNRSAQAPQPVRQTFPPTRRNVRQAFPRAAANLRPLRFNPVSPFENVRPCYPTQPYCYTAAGEILCAYCRAVGHTWRTYPARNLNTPTLPQQ